jgi:hypothetical protein
MGHQNRKSVKDIKTHAGTVRKTFLPHEAYMRISTLEMERVHRLREMESAQKRMKVIADRIKELEREKNALLNQIRAKTDGFRENIKMDIKPDGIPRTKLFRY